MQNASLDSYCYSELCRLKESNLSRDIETYSKSSSKYLILKDKKYLNFSSNNYLGYADHPIIKKAIIDAVETYGSGTGASRLISGTTLLHKELEEEIAKFKATESAMFLSSGYVANLSTIAAILDKNDAVFSDELNHASIIDGIKLSKASKYIYRHNDINHLDELLKNHRTNFNKSLIITDTIFSMDGDVANLNEIVDIKTKYNSILMIDEAHATGLYGENGSGLASEYSLSNHVDIHMGTFSKALGIEGAYIAGSKTLIEYLYNKSRGFIYSTSPSPAIVGGAISSLKLISKDIETRKILWENINYFKKLLFTSNKKGIKPISTDSAIFCFIVPNEELALMIKKRMVDEHNILISAIRPPTVKQSRIRICLNSLMNFDDIDKLFQALEECL